MRVLSLLAVVVFGLIMAFPVFAQAPDDEIFQAPPCASVCDCSYPQFTRCFSNGCPQPYSCMDYCHDLPGDPGDPGEFEANSVVEFGGLGLAMGFSSEIRLNKGVQEEASDENGPSGIEKEEAEKQSQAVGPSAQP